MDVIQTKDPSIRIEVEWRSSGPVIRIVDDASELSCEASLNLDQSGELGRCLYG